MMPGKVKEPSDLRSAHTVILLTPKTKETLKDVAWEKRMSLSELANQIIENYLCTLKE